MPLILLVDDDPTVRLIAEELLLQKGHVVLHAANGCEALAALESAPVDLMILDMLMPDKDGIETLIEARKGYPGLRVLAVSGGGQIDAFDLLRLARFLGADETMTKPLQRDTFTAAVARLLGQPGGGAPVAA